jgi:2-amino-4-hydroxy-6-hydroxymethyldihydropteridine diphosphokinase
MPAPLPNHEPQEAIRRMSGRRPQPQPRSRRPHPPAGDAPARPSAERAVQERLQPPAPVRAFLALGSNMGDRRGYMQGAIARIPDIVAVSHLYETDPVGGPPGQGAYLNCVIELLTRRSPRELLAVAQAAETAAERVRTERWGPRTLDVDVLLVGDQTVDEPDLVVPHPRMWSRGFVLVPLADLAPELVIGHLTSDIARGVRPAGPL